jgi:hypothetical protein
MYEHRGWTPCADTIRDYLGVQELRYSRLPLCRQVLLLVRCAADVTRLWQRVEQNRFPRLREVSM